MQISFRQMATQKEYKSCVALQKETWGQNFGECVPPAILQIAQKVGGISAGAFDQQSRMVGFVFGLTGLKNGQPVHWSHMLAVRRDLRGAGIGCKLKRFQRELLLGKVECIYWTYDPLVAKNAHLNFNKLGVEIAEYVEDMYGEDSGSELHHGLGMDRFIVAWWIATQRVQEILTGDGRPSPDADFAGSAIVNTELDENGHPMPFDAELPTLAALRIEIPNNIESIQRASLEAAAQWRANTKRAFLHYLQHGYKVAGFYRDTCSGRCFYELRQPQA